MLKFKEYILESAEHEAEMQNDDLPIEQHVQNKLFGSNDYIPFKHAHLNEESEDHPDNPKRLVFRGQSHQGKAEGIVVPRHMWEGTPPTVGGKISKATGKPTKPTKGNVGMKEKNLMRAQVYGSEQRNPLTKTQIHRTHLKAIQDHFAKPKAEQLKAEEEARSRLKAAGHLDNGDTTDTSEKTDTVNFEHDDKGRTFTAIASKGVAGHALYTSGTGENEKHHVLNTCLGQTEGCGGGVDSDKLADTSKGTCFAPKAESQYPAASIRRACHAQAKHDPAMTQDWILAHIGSIRKHADKADKKNKRLLFRPNIVDESDTSSYHVIKHLNKQRASERTHEDDKPNIIGNGYGKTGDIHDPENGWYSTYSNTGPKVKNGKRIPENIQRDGSRQKETVSASAGKDAEGNDIHHKNDEGNNTPPKNSYLVTNMKRGSDLDKAFQKHVTHAKYWTKGREQNELSEDEKNQGSEGHFDENGKPTSPENAHYGHTTVNGRRYDYQKQHILHPRMVKVIEKKKVNGQVVQTEHHIPTDSRFMDDHFLPKNRFKSKNGKNAGGILVTTPTTSTTDEQHHSNFTHHVDNDTINHAIANNGGYEIDSPHEQEKAITGGVYEPPKPKASDVKPKPITFSKKLDMVAKKKLPNK